MTPLLLIQLLARSISLIGTTLLPLNSVPVFSLIQDYESPERIAEKAMPSVASLRWVRNANEPNALEMLSGTAFFIERGCVITNWHVAASDFGVESTPLLQIAEHSVLDISGATVAWSSEVLDLVAIRLPDTLRPHKEGAALSGVADTTSYPTPLSWTKDQPKIATTITVIGSPYGLHGTVSTGVVSAIRTGGEPTLIQITAAISPGSSGSPVFNASGLVCAVATMQAHEGQQLNFAVPLTYVPNPLPITGPSLGLWASVNCTPIENRHSRLLFESAKDEATHSLKAILEGLRDSGGGRPNGNFFDASEVESLLVSLEDDLPDRILPGAASPPLGYWARIVIGLDDTAGRFSARMRSIAREAMLAGSNEPDVLKWMADLNGDEVTLRKRSQLAPSDEAIAWEHLQELSKEAVYRCIQTTKLAIAQEKLSELMDEETLSIDEVLSGKGSTELREALMNVKMFGFIQMNPPRLEGHLPIEEFGNRCLAITQDLESRSSAWKRVPSFHHERGKALLLLGRFEQSKLAFEERFLCTSIGSGRELTSIDLIMHEAVQKTRFDHIYAHLIRDRRLQSNDALSHAKSRHDTAMKLLDQGLANQDVLEMLAIEMEQICDAVAEFSTITDEQSPQGWLLNHYRGLAGGLRALGKRVGK